MRGPGKERLLYTNAEPSCGREYIRSAPDEGHGEMSWGLSAKIFQRSPVATPSPCSQCNPFFVFCFLLPPHHPIVHSFSRAITSRTPPKCSFARRLHVCSAVSAAPLSVPVLLSAAVPAVAFLLLATTLA